MITIEEVNRFINELTERHLVLTIYELKQKLVDIMSEFNNDISQEQFNNYINNKCLKDKDGVELIPSFYSEVIHNLKTELVCFCNEDYIKSIVYLFKTD